LDWWGKTTGEPGVTINFGDPARGNARPPMKVKLTRYHQKKRGGRGLRAEKIGLLNPAGQAFSIHAEI
jgi:hypothetical protein